MISDPDAGVYTPRVPDIPAYGEGDTPEEAIVDLQEALRGDIEALRGDIEAFGLEDALARVNSPTVQSVDWGTADYTEEFSG